MLPLRQKEEEGGGRKGLEAHLREALGQSGKERTQGRLRDGQKISLVSREARSQCASDS